MLGSQDAEGLIAFATSVDGDLMGAAFCALATQLAVPRLARMLASLGRDERSLLLLLSMLTRDTQDRVDLRSCLDPTGGFADDLGAAMHSDRQCGDELAANVAARVASQAGRQWFDNLTLHGAGEQLQWLLPRFGVFAAG